MTYEKLELLFVSQTSVAQFSPSKKNKVMHVFIDGN
jgi:hypothetical protein